MKKLLNKFPFKKFVAIFTSIIFLFTGVFGNSAYASIGSSMPAIGSINFDTPIIPTSLGKITSAKYFDSEDIIINIQDLHCHAETQRKIASIIEYIDNVYNLKNVYLEGAFKTVDTSWLSAFNNNKNGTKVLEGLIDSGKLSGTEYYSIMNNKKNFVLGIEKEEIYKENIKLLGSILSLQPEIEAICSQMEKEVNKIKRDYSSRQARKLQKLIKSFKEKEIDAKYFYGQLKMLADSSNLSLDKYPNIKIYISLLDKAQYVNDKRVVYEFTKFISEIKNILPYQSYSDLLKNSNNFSNLEDISADLIALNKKYSITTKLKLANFENFLTYLEFNQNINPIKLVQEEELFVNELYAKLGRTKYEKEVAFLSEFVPTIKQYFTADISADEYYKFEKNYSFFKATWPSYFSENIIKNLEPYQRLLAKYHKNNIIRDQIFADCLITQKNTNNKIAVNDVSSAVKQIKNNLNNKKIKLVVTGGFHTRGLERIFEQQKISYVIITPKITQPVEQAKQIYIDNVIYYSNILKNTINLEPLTQEPLNVSFPKIMNLIFSLAQEKSIFEDENIKDAIKQFVQEYIIDKQDSFYGAVDIVNWDITSIGPKGQAEFYVEYIDNANKKTKSNIKYRFVDGEIIPYSSIDIIRTKQMLERVTSNKYALPSIEIEPTNTTRKKIAKYILEPLEKVVGKTVTLMPFEQLHMTIGYDSSLTQQQIDSLVQQEDTYGDIFSALDILGEDFVDFRTSMAGTLKLMPDGVIIYEITDKDLIENILQFRTSFKSIDSKFGTPSIVHMSVGRITDMKLLDDSKQSKQELAELLEKLNETIYEINKKNALSKIKTTFTLKAGYVSSTGDKDFVFRRLLPKKEGLVIFSNAVDDSKQKLSTVYKIVIAPLIEEFLFRFVPFFVAGLVVASPVSIVPAIVTGIVGIFGFSFVHPLADKINNYFYNKKESGDTKTGFINRLFKEQVRVRNVMDFLIPSTILSAVFVTVSFAFPQATFAAFILTYLLHALNNVIAAKRENMLLLSIMQNTTSQEKNLDFELNQIIETLEKLAKSKSITSIPELDKFLSDFKDIQENYDSVGKEVLSEKVIELFKFVSENEQKQKYFDINYLLVPLLNISAKLRDKNGNILFDTIVNFVLKQASDKKIGSTRYHDVLIESAKHLYKNGEFTFVHKIIDALYKNKSDVKSVVEYGRFALPVSSPFSFDTIEEWEQEITEMMKQDADIFPNWYESMLEIFLASSSEGLDEYAKAFLRALYKSGKRTTPPYVKNFTGYEWAKTFYEVCGDGNGIFIVEQSEPLLDREDIKSFTDKIKALEIENLYLSDIISRLQFLKNSKPSNEALNSEQYSQIIEKLTAALSLPKKAQLQVVKEQIKVLYTYLFENGKFESDMLELLAPVLGVLIKEGKTTFLEDICNKLFEQGIKDSKMNFGFTEIAYIYSLDKEKALTLITKKFEETSHTVNPLYVQLYGRNWDKFSPKTIEEAREAIPKELQKVIFEYNDLEAFYNAIGISFDLIGEQSQLFDRDMYVPEYQPLFSFVPKNILDFKKITKYFRTLKSEQVKILDVSEEKELALDRIQRNGNLALANISNSAEDLKIAVGYIEKMLQDFKLISSNADDIHELEQAVEYIKWKVEEGEIDDILTKEVAWWVKDKGIYAVISDINEKAISETKNMADKFDAFERVLENNEFALSSLTRMNEDSINDTIYFIEEMLDAFEIIDPRLAQKAKISLLRIKKDIRTGSINIESLSKLNSWTEDGLDKIKELHTLINAVHQTSTTRLMTIVEFSSSNIGGRKAVLRQDGSDQIAFYDCSIGSIKDEMKEFLVTLAEINKKYDGRWVIKDNKLLYSKQLGFHGVNILVDMEEGIRVTFNESGRGDGNALRTTLLATLFAQAGFDITYVDTLVTESVSIGGPCKFTAVYNLKNDFNAPEKYAFLFSQALEILSNTRDVDYALEDDNENENPHYQGVYYIPKLTIEDYRKMKNSFTMPEEFKKGKTGGLVSYWTARVENVKKLRNIFEKSKKEEREEFSALYDYLGIDTEETSPWKIVGEYIKGKLIINKETGVLERNTEYDGINSLLDAIETNFDDSLRQAQVINLLDSDNLNFETEGYIGGMVALSGLLRLDGNGWLSVKTAVDKERKRSKFAYVEFVDFEGNRTPLNHKDLIKILKKFGYTVKEQKPRSLSERKESLTVLKEKILYPKDGIYTRGMSVSGQADKYIPVTVTYDKNKVDENSMWVVSFTSPEDVASIIKAGAIMTTTGGMLSHANITARENNKTAILSNGQWVDGKLVVPYYSIESPIEQRRGYEIQKISEHHLVLEEGAVVLANGINGRVLVYNNIPKQTIVEIQKAIDENDVDFIMQYIQNHYQDENIRQVVEYIFLQVITDKEKLKITQFLLAWEKESEIGMKVSELVDVYTGEKIKALKIYIENEKKIEDANIRLAIIKFIEQELKVLEYSLTDDDVAAEMQKLMEIVGKDKNLVRSQIKEEVTSIIEQVKNILAKTNISEKDKDYLTKISETATVWGFYGNSELKDLVSKIREILSFEQPVSYDTEIRGFEDIKAKDILRYGTKTTELAKLSKLFTKKYLKLASVPYGMGISKDVLRLFFEQNGLGEQYLQLSSEFEQAIKSQNKSKAIEVGRQISKLIDSVDDEELEKYLKNKLKSGKKYAVRSSGVGEDGGTHAFAGMAETKLNVSNDEVYKNVKECWKSFFSYTCIEDMVKEGIVVQPALLIQEMVVDVKKAGVMFTRDNSGNLTIESVLGLGDGLVSGRITPDHISVRAFDGRIEYRRALSNMIKIVEKEEGGTDVSKLTREEKIERILDEETINTLKEIASILEEDAGYPVDVEFAIDENNNIFVLQRRAITTLPSIEESDYSQEETAKSIISQAAIDKLTEILSFMSGYKEIKGVIDNLSNLPENVSEQYDYVLQQMYILIDFLKTQHFMKKTAWGSSSLDADIYLSDDSPLKTFCLENNLVDSWDSKVKIRNLLTFALVSFFAVQQAQNLNESLFHSIIDYWLIEQEDRGNSLLDEMFVFVGSVYSVNPEFVSYIVNALMDKDLVAMDDKNDLPYYISSNLRNNPDALRQFYITYASREKSDDDLSIVLEENVVKLRNIVSLVSDETSKESITNIISEIDKLIGRVNYRNIQLLEQNLNELFEEAIKLKDVNRDACFEIINTMLSVCKQILEGNKDIKSTILKINKLYSLLVEEYDVDPNSKYFNDTLSQLVSLIQWKEDDLFDQERDSFNKNVSKMLANLALYIYKPISSKELADEDSPEYQSRKQKCLDIFRELALGRVDDREIYIQLCNITEQYGSDKIEGIGFTPETLEIFISSAKANKYVYNLLLPEEEFISDDVEQLSGMIFDSIENINPVQLFTTAYSEEINELVKRWSSKPQEAKNRTKAKQIANNVMKKLVLLANDESADYIKRRRAVIILLNTMANGIYSEAIKDVPVDFDNIRVLASKLDIPIYLYMSNVGIRNINLYYEYNFTPLINLLPQFLFDGDSLLGGDDDSEYLSTSVWDKRDKNRELLNYRKPVITTIEGETNTSNVEVLQVLFRFKVLQKILQYNTSVLSLMDKIKDSKNYEKNMAELLSELQGMINELKKINPEHGAAAQIALDNIKSSLENPSIDRKTQVRRNLLLSEWNEETISDIKEIHTLINAVHQTSIADFKQEIGDVRSIGDNPIQVIKAKQTSTVSGYNLSDTVNSNIVRFLSELATRKLPYDEIDDFVCKDDLIVWTTRLNAHSVDVFFNFGDVDRGISIYYRERPVFGEDIGKKERVRYFKEILEYLGFHVDSDIEYSDGHESYGIKATLNKDYGLSDSTDLIDIATHVVEIFKFSTNVDYDLKNCHRTIEAQYKRIFEGWLTKAKRRELWCGVDINNWGQRAYGYGPRGQNLTKLPSKRNLNPEFFNAILSYLGCDLLPSDTEKSLEKMLKDPIFVDKYFNEPIEKAFIEGRLKLNEDGILVRNEGYDIVHSMIDEINTNFIETSQQARIVNLVNNYEFNTRILADIGSFVVVSSVMELKNGTKLFVKAIMDPNTKRTKYAIAELVTNRTRQKLTSDELIYILGKEGYVIEKQEWVDSRERARTKSLLTRQLQSLESPKIQSTPTSDGTGVSVVGNITFNKDNVDENSILVVPYTTPNDMKHIETAKGIITTGGGVLSHAAITTRELKKPSVVLGGATWTDDELEILYYLASGDVELIDNQFQVQKVKTTRKMLKEGSRVLMNGETGIVLLFDDIDISLLDELQSYIDSDNSQAVIDFMTQHSNDENINRFVEYVYFQVIGNVKTTQVLDSLFSDDMPETVKDKIKKLNDGYIQDKIQSISEAIENLKTIENVNIAYNILQELIKKVKFIKTVGVRQDLEDLKKQIEEMEIDIKDRLDIFMQQFINDLSNLLTKDELSSTNVQKILSMIKNAEIYKFFVSESETSKDLIAKKDTIQLLVSMIKDRINSLDMDVEYVDLKEEISLFEENASDERLFGSKTSQLAKMFKLLLKEDGVVVPGGIGISVRVMPLLFKTLGQESLLTEFETAVKYGNKAKAMEIAKTICDLIDSDETKDSDIEKEIKAQLEKFIKPGGKYSVRSSGVGEDAANNAFAGMGETSLNVQYVDIYEHIKNCWKSFFAERCVDYMISSGQVVKPAVLVEEMIDSEISGVAFTRNKYGNGTINALFGQGEGLVSGMFTPDDILFDMKSGEVIEYSVANKQFQLITDVNGGIKKVPVGQKAKTRTLNSTMVKRLAAVFSTLENAVGYPVDVEFAIKGDEIYILQMRPITTLDSKEQSKEKVTDTNSDSDIVNMDEIPFAETKYEITLTVGKIKDKNDVFAYIANPSDPTNAIPVYKKSVNGEYTEFVVDSKFTPLVKNGILSRLLLHRINTDSVVLAKLNDGLFNFKSGEIALMPILDEEMFEKELLENTLKDEMNNVRRMLASA